VKTIVTDVTTANGSTTTTTRELDAKGKIVKTIVIEVTTNGDGSTTTTTTESDSHGKVFNTTIKNVPLPPIIFTLSMPSPGGAEELPSPFFDPDQGIVFPVLVFPATGGAGQSDPHELQFK